VSWDQASGTANARVAHPSEIRTSASDRRHSGANAVAPDGTGLALILLSHNGNEMMLRDGSDHPVWFDNNQNAYLSGIGTSCFRFPTEPGDTSLESQPNRERQALQEPTGRSLDATRTPRNALPVSIRHFRARFGPDCSASKYRTQVRWRREAPRRRGNRCACCHEARRCVRSCPAF